MSLKFTGSFSELQAKLSSLSGEWDESQSNKKVLRVGGGIFNWFESTGTIQFQGKGTDKELLEKQASYLIYPEQFSQPEPTADIGSQAEPIIEQPPFVEQTLERKYLESGINDSELIIGVVSAVGTESKRVIDPLKDRLRGFGYSVEEIRVSAILPDFVPTEASAEYDRIKHYMASGDRLRKESENNAILAAGVTKQISTHRNGSPAKKAYIINSLKHPDEAGLLRKVYGDGFYLIGIHGDEKRRHKYLTDDKGCTLGQANELISVDEDESFAHGQKTRDTYHLSDFFLNLGKNDDHVKNRLQRFLELIFSHPYKNPTFDEFAMFMAFNSSVRSGDLSRQVGAVISQENQIIATGANDVPQSGGGLYWAEADPETGEVNDHPDGKDYTRDGDSNKQAQAEIVQEIAKKLLEDGLVPADKELDLTQILKRSKISDLTEFGRVVHAEMDAMLSCSRAGIPTVGTTLYCTTFPCHNCAKHIIASGMKRVVYVEPYPKSRALDFHSESIQLKSEFDTSSKETGLIAFEPFIGVGPRRFLDLFSMSLGAGSKLKRKDKMGSTLDWEKSTAPIRTPLVPRSYIDIESSAVDIWEEQSLTNNATAINR